MTKSSPLLPDHEREKVIADLQRELHGLQQNRASAVKVQHRDPSVRELVVRLDGEIATAEARLRELRPPTSGEQLVELAAKIAATEGELAQLKQQRTSALEAKIKLEPEAAERVAEIDERLGEAEGRLSTLRQRQGQLQGHVAEHRAADRRQTAAGRPLRLAELRQEHAALAAEITNAARVLAAAFKAMEDNNQAIAAQLDDQNGHRFFSAAAFRWRAMNSLARAFAIDPTKPLTIANSLFGLASDAIGPQAQWGLDRWEEEGLDDLAPYFTSEAEAEAGRDRLQRRNCPTIIVKLGGELWTLVRHEHVFGDEARARHAAARSTTPMAVVAHGDGFVLVPQRFSGEAA